MQPLLNGFFTSGFFGKLVFTGRLNLELIGLPILLALALTGMFAGFIAGLLGVGGGIIIVPVLYFVLPLFGVSASNAMAIATATSLATIIPTAISSIAAHYRRGHLEMSILRWWSGFILCSATIGSILATQLAGHTLTAIFGIIALLVSLNMLFRANARPLAQHLPNRFVQAVFASLIGFFSVMVGIGGGTLSVSLLTLFNTATHKAVGTAAAFGLLIAIPGAIILLLFGQTPPDAPAGTVGLVNLPAFIAIVPLTVLFAPVGAKVSATLNQAQLKKVFAVALFITAGRMLYQVV